MGTACAAPPKLPRYSDARAVKTSESLGDPDQALPDRSTLDPADPGWLGVELQAMQNGQSGVRVVDVVRRSPASTAGLLAGDVVLHVEGEVIADPGTLVRRIRRTSPGTKLSLGVSRKGKLQSVAILVEATPNPDELTERRFVGSTAPPLEGLTVVRGDGAANWNALRGHLVVLEFWAPWCGVCHLMHTRLNEWQSQWAMYGVRVIGIAALGPDEARLFAERFSMGYTIAADAEELVFRSYDVFAVPTLFLVDRDGTIVDATTGYSSQRLAQIEKRLIGLVGRDAMP